jgi:hypothetical protein
VALVNLEGLHVVVPRRKNPGGDEAPAELEKREHKSAGHGVKFGALRVVADGAVLEVLSKKPGRVPVVLHGFLSGGNDSAQVRRRKKHATHAPGRPSTMNASWLAGLAFVAAGSGLGALMGYFGQCSSGTCPLTSTWWRGALYGGFLGLVLAVSRFN